MKKVFRSIAVIFLAVILASQLAACRTIPVGEFGRYVFHAPEYDPVIPDTPDEPDPGVPDVPSYTREDIPFSSLSYERPDTQKIRNAIDTLSSKVRAGGNAEELVAEYQEILKEYDHLDSLASLAYIYYAQDVTEQYYEDEYNYLFVELNEIDLPLTDLTIQMYQSDVTCDAMRATFSDSFEDNTYLGKERNSEAIQDDLKRFSELTSEYDEMLSTFTVTIDGREYSEEDLADSYDGDYYAYIDRLHAYYDQMNEKIGPLYLELVEVNCRIAKTLGYTTFTGYQYEGYQRDYTPEEARKIHQAVKDYLVPAYKDAYYDFYYTSRASYYADGPIISYSGFMKKFEPALKKLSPELLEPFNYMKNNDLIDRTVNTNKMMTSFTIYLEDPVYPFIFMQWTDDFDSCSTIMHEFGHFSSYFLNPHVGWNMTDPLDIAEVDSQGLEMLMMAHYEDFFGSEYADPLRGDNLLESIYIIISGCMEDEFQQEVYANPGMTLEEMNNLYARLAMEYGLDTLFPYNGTEWVAIPHTFQSPLYYFSYAASMIVALELWEMGQTNQTKAEDTYLAILHRPDDSLLRTLTTDVGLSDPIDPETVRSLSKSFSNWMKRFN